MHRSVEYSQWQSGNYLALDCYVVAKGSQELAILHSLQGILGVPNLLPDQCGGDSMLMRPVLAPLTAGASFVHNLHNSLLSLVQTLKVTAVHPSLAATQAACLPDYHANKYKRSGYHAERDDYVY